MKLRNVAGIAVIAIAAAGCSSASGEPAEKVTMTGTISVPVQGIKVYAYGDNDCREDGTTGIYERGAAVTATSASGEVVGEGSLLSPRFKLSEQPQKGTCSWDWGVTVPDTTEKYTLTFSGGHTMSGTIDTLNDGTTVFINGS